MSQTLEVTPLQVAPTGIPRLEAAVQQQLNGRLSSFRLLASSRGLILQGEAQSFHAKQLAQHLIMKESELPILANDIVVLAC